MQEAAGKKMTPCQRSHSDPRIGAGSKWTAREPVLGWRHFVVTERRKTDASMYAYLIATCDTEVGIWVSPATP